VVPASGEKTMLNASNANLDWIAQDIEKAVEHIHGCPSGSVLIVDFEVPHTLVAASIKVALGCGFAILVDPTFPEAVDKRLFRGVTSITPNIHEAEVLLGRSIRDEAGASEAARDLMSLGPETVCLKLSDGGCVFANDSGRRLMKPVEVDVVDKTGAGDAFIAGLAGALVEGQPMQEAARWGIAGSSFSVTRREAQNSYPTRSEFFSMLENAKEASINF
jgi:ribokinase